MSTRASIIVQDGYERIQFYRHSDGFPTGTMPLLERFMEHVRAGRIRANASQAAGWLVIMGAQELVEIFSRHDGMIDAGDGSLADYKPSETLFGWKASTIEPCQTPPADIEYVYTVDVGLQSIRVTYPDGSPVPAKEAA